MEETKRKIKILQVCAIDETVKSLLLPLIDRLTAEGFDVTSCCSRGKNSESLSAQSYHIENIDIARKISFLSNLKSLLALRGLMKREKYDIVHVHTPVAALLGRIAARMAGIPVIVYTAHGFYFHDRMTRMKYRILVNIEKFAGRLFTDYLFTQSEEDRLTGIKEKIISAGKISTISNGVDVRKKFNPGQIEHEQATRKRKELGISESDKVIMFTGRLVKEKGIVELLEAFQQLRLENTKLLLVGDRFTAERDTETYNTISRICQGNPNIIMAGLRSDIPDLLDLSNLFVLPSYREGMPRSIIEAMAMGKPVVATNIRGCREEVVDGETGFLVPVNNANALAEAMQKILQDEILAAEMGEKARIRAEDCFDEEKVLDREVSVLKRLIREKIKNQL